MFDLHKCNMHVSTLYVCISVDKIMRRKQRKLAKDFSLVHSTSCSVGPHYRSRSLLESCSFSTVHPGPARWYLDESNVDTIR